MNIKDQYIIIKYIRDYLKQKFISYTYSAQKYIYRQNYLIDLIDFR